MTPLDPPNPPTPAKTLMYAMRVASDRIVELERRNQSYEALIAALEGRNRQLTARVRRYRTAFVAVVVGLVVSWGGFLYV